MKNVREIVHWRLKLLFIIVLVIALFAMSAGCGTDTASDSNTDNITEEDAISEDDKDVDSNSDNKETDDQIDNVSEADDRISEGEYVVGIDMPAGEYFLYKYEDVEGEQASAPFISVDNAEGDYISHLNFKNLL
ncbi:MAG: hypothetical protein HN389_09450 [Clostridia bacterium]|jgi:hypothetical protein|nr:hypothetical protein [Clostridia bacterium]